MVYQRNLWLLIAFGMCLPGVMHSQPAPVLEAFTDPAVVRAGESFEVGFRLRNAEGKNFRPPVWDKNLRVLAGPSSEQSMGYINGRSYTQQSWRFLVEVRRPGTVIIGAASVVADDKTLQSQPITLLLTGNTVAAPTGNNSDAFLITELSAPVAYIGQQIMRRTLLYTTIDIDGLDILEIPAAKGCFAADRKRFDARLRNQTLRGKKYVVKTLTETSLFPQETGVLTIDPAKIRIDIQQPGSPGNFFNTTSRILESPPVTVEVKALPVPAPPVFTGCTGRYLWELKADKKNLTTDDALTMTLSVRGNGDPHRFIPPALTLPSGLEALDPKTVSEEQYETESEWVHEQVLEYAILPKVPGDYVLQPILSWFQPDSNQYGIYRPDTLHVQVTAGTNYSAAAKTPLAGAETDQNTGLRSAWWQTHNLRKIFRPSFWWLVVLGFGGLLFFLLSKRHRPVPETDLPTVEVPKETTVPALPPEPPFRTLMQQAQQAIARPDPDAEDTVVYRILLKAMQSFLHQELHLPSGPLDRQQVLQMLQERPVAPVAVQNLFRIWDQCEAALYGHWEGAPPPRQLLEETEKITNDLKNALQT